MSAEASILQAKVAPQFVTPGAIDAEHASKSLLLMLRHQALRVTGNILGQFPGEFPLS